jgi:hypothetical protein
MSYDVICILFLLRMIYQSGVDLLTNEVTLYDSLNPLRVMPWSAEISTIWDISMAGDMVGVG